VFSDDAESAAERTEELEENLQAVATVADDFVLTMRDGTEAITETSSVVRTTVKDFEKMAEAVREISNGVRSQNSDILLTLEYEGQRLNKQLEIIRATGGINDNYDIMEQTAMAVLDVEEDRASALADIERKYQDLVAAGYDEAEAIRLKREEVAEVNALYDTQIVQVREIARRNAETRVEIQRQVRAAQDLARVQESVGDYMADLKRGTEEAQREIERMNMSVLERELDDINTRLERDLQDQIAEINRTEIDPIVKQEKIRELTAATEEAKQAQREAAAAAYDYSRSFQYGWKRAFEEYASDATNAAKTAEEIFRTTTQGMEDALVGLIRTGKFEWRDFVNELVELLLRAELKRLIADVFGAVTGAGGGGSGGGSGGGGKTPGILGAVGGVVKGVVGGIGKLFGGAFASGGSLPGGQFGIVGEAGPELITGPATITPLQGLGSTTNVTYNISAVDAASFRSLVARDPEFIHAVAMKGGSSVPMRR
jgi:lambda family phage tail tape measure protein